MHPINDKTWYGLDMGPMQEKCGLGLWTAVNLQRLKFPAVDRAVDEWWDEAGRSKGVHLLRQAISGDAGAKVSTPLDTKMELAASDKWSPGVRLRSFRILVRSILAALLSSIL